MYGLEKKGNLMEFDLEKDLLSHPTKLTELLTNVRSKIGNIKTLLRDGAASGPEFDQLGVLLQGYTAAERVLTRIANKQTRK